MQDIAQWQQGSGVIVHRSETVARIDALMTRLGEQTLMDVVEIPRLLMAADTLCNMGLWLTAHMTYAKQVYLDGRTLTADDFKLVPEGHTGGALNMVPAYVGYLLANAISGKTRAWMMGQGHCVAAIDAVNALVGNQGLEQAERYKLSDTGLSQLCQDFYSYAIDGRGRPAAPLGSHVGPYTAGGVSEGGYLGFAELQYVHMPLPGQELVTFLSDGAFEEQRGSDWASRWWRADDCGLVMPIMIANGRRIDQRSTLAQIGGVDWFKQHLTLNGFEPITIDGRDPAAFAWAIISMAMDLEEKSNAIARGELDYPVRLPYTIAETIKGFGFPGAGTNAAHNLPLSASPALDTDSRAIFNAGAQALYQDQTQLMSAVACLNNHARKNRVSEKSHCLTAIATPCVNFPVLEDIAVGQVVAPMEAIDHWFSSLVIANPALRVRVGNPDEMRSNRLNKTLDLLAHRVTAPEAGIAERLDGSVITALNEEAVIAAALANKQGINMAASYEAFAVKMLGAMRQEIIFSRHQKEVGQEVNWLAVPVLLSSHTWENGKNEQSHQDPTLCEAWLQEMSDVAPVIFPCDAMSAMYAMQSVYHRRGAVAAMVVPKNKMPNLLDAAQARQLTRDGALLLESEGNAAIQLLAVGAYQLHSAQRAAQRLKDHGVGYSLVTISEPGKFRIPRDSHEAVCVHSEDRIEQIIPAAKYRVLISHTHAEPMIGVLRPLDLGPSATTVLGYKNRGGTLDTFAMQFANGQTWAHVVLACASLLNMAPESLLSQDEMAALAGELPARLLQ
ncbi:phosphoketolase [Simiduia litorea]|uniref:xylulose 5-phosphate 3-epimerase n=1 Tax=Simiduia litorea TaxID=1435348 RepID=UPI0036F32AF6